MALGQVTIRRFEDGEIYARFEESVRGEDVFVIQPTCSPVNENLVELLVMVDALRRASAGRITAVMPYYGYARQDKKHAPREPITGRLGGRSFDDAYAAPTGPCRLGAVTITFEEGFPYSQVFAPPAAERLVSIEPMTVPANALVTGAALLRAPHAAAFVLRTSA